MDEFILDYEARASAAMAKISSAKPSGRKASKNAGSDDTDGRDDKIPTAKALIDMAMKFCDLFHDERQDGYAVTTHNGIRRTLKLRGREFRRWLAGTYYAQTERPANNEAMASALHVLEAKAAFDGRELELSNRFAWRDGAIYVDTADSAWRVVKVTSSGWQILDTPPVMFRRYSHQQALPDPVRGARLSDIHRHLAIRHDDDKLLLEAWLVACAFPHLPRPAVTFHGPQGASKSTAARILKSITDPSVTESADIGKGPADLAQVLDHHGIPCFDNLSSIPGWAADLLCRAVTGGAFSKRELYSDDSDILMTFKRAMVITGINIPTHAPDLLDRLLLIELERIPPELRMDEATFWASFNNDGPRLFGALLDALAGTLKHLPKVKLDRMPRMADFAKIACAYAECAGYGAERMLDIIMRHAGRQTQEVLDADPVASAIRDFIRARKTWTGTAQQMLVALNERVQQPRPDGWPKQANSLSRRLNVLHATLNEIGITIRRHKGAEKDRLITLEIDAEISSPSPLSSEASIHARSSRDDKGTITKSSPPLSSPREASIHAGSDGRDDMDDESDIFSSDPVEMDL